MKKIVAMMVALMMLLGMVSVASAQEGQVVSVMLGGGTPQFMAAPFNQQRTQTLQQRLMGLAHTGQTEQATEWLAQIANRFVWCDKRQTWAFDRLFAVQPPQAIAQRQRFDLLQHGRKAIAHAVGLTQQARTTPY